MAGRERNAAWNWPDGRGRKSAGIRGSPHEHAGARKKKGQPSVVGLYALVEAAGIEPAFYLLKSLFL